MSESMDLDFKDRVEQAGFKVEMIKLFKAKISTRFSYKIWSNEKMI